MLADRFQPPSITTSDRRTATLLLALLVPLLVFWYWPSLQILKSSETLFPASVHTISELFAVVVSMLIVAVSWNAYTSERSGNIIILACGFAAVGLLDLAHMLSYKGMPDFVTPAAPQKAVAFWLAARIASALTLLVIAVRPWTPLPDARTRYTYLGLALATVVLVYVLQLYYPAIWPALFIPGQGLTATKVATEYGIIALLEIPALLLFRLRRQRPEAAALFVGTMITILSEVCLTLYANVNDIFSLIGHAYKVLAYVFIYRAVFVSSVREPFQRLSAEVEQRQAAEERISFLAYHDPLTELPNRLMLRTRFHEALLRAGDDGSRLALVFIDLDNFKHINDSMGHLQGDRVLQEMAKRLTQAVGAGNTVSRLGGDEFLLLATGLSGAEELLPTLDAVMARAQAPMLIGGQELTTSLSIGIALTPDDGTDFDTLLQKADTAMYRAKQSGRNAYRYFTQAMLAEVIERHDIRNGLAQALKRDEFVLHYQPQIDLRDGRLIGVEALIRWQRPGHGMVPPGRFISVAEECGLIVPIGAWVVRSACQQMALWRAAGLEDVTVAVNLSSLQFSREDIEQTVSEALAASGLPPACLELELTESILVQEADLALVKVQRLRQLGVRLSIDDFGTGYSSLAYLKQFAVHQLKIDQSFVRHIASHPDDTAIVRAIIQLADGLGLSTIAEGVETQEVAAQIKALGCASAQGYYYAKPMPADQLLNFVCSRQPA
ncbi:MAG: putative bifunctional diguanylate cyclase/phosphodiesterase [Sphingomonadaceae bacterium]